MIKFPVAMPDLAGNEERYVTDAIRSSWISSSGSYLKTFEANFATRCDTAHAVGVCNGTAALHLALAGMGLGPGDEVLIPSLTFIATANAVRYMGAEPVFVDVSADTWCIDPKLLARSITDRTRGVIPVHLYGHPADMDPILEIASAHGLWVVEDAAEAHFAKYKGRLVGSIGNLATFSFYGNKILTSGEGGAVTVNDNDLASKIRILCGQGQDPHRRYYFPVLGYNFRMTNIVAALLCAQLERESTIIAERRRVFRDYEQALAGIAGVTFQPVAAWAEPAPWLFSILVAAEEFGRDRDSLASLLLERGIDTRPFFIPLHRLPPYVGAAASRRTELPVTDLLASRGLNLPTYGSLTTDEITFIASVIRDAAKR